MFQGSLLWLLLLSMLSFTFSNVPSEPSGDLQENPDAEWLLKCPEIESRLKNLETEVKEIKSGQALATESMTSLQRLLASSRQQSEEDGEVKKMLQKIRAGIRFMNVQLMHALGNLTDVTGGVEEVADAMTSIPTKSDFYLAMDDLELLFRNSISPPKLPSMFGIPSKTNLPLPLAQEYPRQCMDIFRDDESAVSGVFHIKPPTATRPIFAFCDMTTAGGGWTVFQSRQSADLSFNRPRREYKAGFGNVASENFWLGLDALHHLTNLMKMELRIELDDGEKSVYASYQGFAISPGNEGYRIQFLGKYEGTAGDSLSFHAGQSPFVTQDMLAEGDWYDCAKRDGSGGWWYRSCDQSNLNGAYFAGSLPANREYEGIYWEAYKGKLFSLSKSRMMVRPMVRD